MEERKTRVLEYLSRDYRKTLFVPQDIHDAALSYIQAGGKALRPCALFFSCGAVGGDERIATPAAVAVEVFHTWTLVHDDIMDRDTLRRGQPTVHEAFRARALTRPGYSPDEARHYGLAIGIMSAEAQHGWAVSLMSELYDAALNNADVTITLIRELETEVLLALVGGQTLDIQFSKTPLDGLTEDDILDVLWRKTGALYRFTGLAGAMIGLNTADRDHPLVQALATFTSECGVAFQLQDDVLGLVGEQETLGKPVGSDLREGKRTTVLAYAFQKADAGQKRRLLDVVGNPEASEEAIRESRRLIIDLGGVEYTRELATRRITRAIACLDALSPSPYKTYLTQWAEFLIGRSF